MCHRIVACSTGLVGLFHHYSSAVSKLCDAQEVLDLLHYIFRQRVQNSRKLYFLYFADRNTNVAILQNLTMPV